MKWFGTIDCLCPARCWGLPYHFPPPPAMENFFLYIFWRARVCRPLLCLCRSFMIFEGCLDSNPEYCRSKLARYRLSHPSPYLSHPSPYLATHSPDLATHPPVEYDRDEYSVWLYRFSSCHAAGGQSNNTCEHRLLSFGFFSNHSEVWISKELIFDIILWISAHWKYHHIRYLSSPLIIIKESHYLATPEWKYINLLYCHGFLIRQSNIFLFLKRVRRGLVEFHKIRPPPPWVCHVFRKKKKGGKW